MNRREYRRLLQDPKWKIKAQFIRKRDGHKCQHCGKKSHRLQVHHTIYVNGLNPWEYENETLISLCSTCHKKEHNIKPAKPRKRTAKATPKKAKIKKRVIMVKVIKDE